MSAANRWSLTHGPAAVAWVCVILSGASKPATALQPGATLPARPAVAVAKPAARFTVKSIPDVKFATVDGKDLLLDMFLPVPPDDVSKEPGSASGPFPVIVWIHGGGWQEGDRHGCPAEHLVPRGYAAVSIEYRLTTVAPFPAQIQDCKGAIRWVRAHAREYNFDPERIGVWGASAGGHLAALLGTSSAEKQLEGDTGGNLDQPSNVQAVCDWFGPTDLLKLFKVPDEAPKKADPAKDPAQEAKPSSDPFAQMLRRFVGAA
jgi:acetyl esterase/lipase